MRKNKYLIIIGVLLVSQIALFCIVFSKPGFTIQEFLIEEDVRLGRSAANIPEAYGHLVAVSVSDSVHHLFFEAGDGTVRIVYLTRPQKQSFAKHKMILGSETVYTLNRE